MTAFPSSAMGKRFNSSVLHQKKTQLLPNTQDPVDITLCELIGELGPHEKER